jgi:hypothetical protein
MGNTLSDTGTLKKDTILANYVRDWALNDYNPNPKANAKNLYKYSLKKRACCTGQKEIQISLPDVDILTNEIKLTSIGVPVFEKDADINDQNCSIISKDSGDKEQFKFTEKKSGLVLANNIACSRFYGQLCPNIINDRIKPDLTKSQKYYSVYGDKIDGENYTGLNPYIDCNCENSFFIKDRDLFEVDQYDTETIAQSNDIRCSGPSEKTFKLTDKKVQNICINMARVGSVSQADQSHLNLNQNCSIGNSPMMREREKKKKEEDDRKKKEDDDRKKKEDDDRKKKEDDDRKKKEDDDRKKKEDDDRKKKEDDDRKKKEDDDRKKKEDDDRKKKDGERKKKQQAIVKDENETTPEIINNEKNKGIIDYLSEFSEKNLKHKYTIWVIIGLLLLLILISIFSPGKKRYRPRDYDD